MPPKAAKLLGPYRKRVRTEPQPADTPELAPKKGALLGPYRKRRRANPEPPPAPALPKTYATWPKSIQTALQKADQRIATQPNPEDDVLFMAMHEKRHMYEGAEIETWGIYKTLRSANWKTAEKFVRKYSDVLDEFCEDGVFLEGYVEPEGQEVEDESESDDSEDDEHDYNVQEEDDGRHQYVVRVSKEGLLEIKAITGEVLGKVYIKRKKLDD